LLPVKIHAAIENFRASEWMAKILGEDVKGRYTDLKRVAADRCARLLGA
jgi:glutamine synthetase